jgi:hypothetical protein
VSQQCLAVPAGLVVRKAGSHRRSWELHLFTRASSVFCFVQTAARTGCLILADAHACEAFPITEKELEFALRAWFSPLPPPLAAELTDLE